MCTGLQTLDLHMNALSGPLPDWLGEFSALKELFLDSNKFSGKIPESLARAPRSNVLVIAEFHSLSAGRFPV